jgi:hypothetical protein
VLETIGKVLGELSDAPVVNVIQAPQFVAVRQVILTALERHPEARLDVLKALEGVQ